MTIKVVSKSILPLLTIFCHLYALKESSGFSQYCEKGEKMGIRESQWSIYPMVSPRCVAVIQETCLLDSFMPRSDVSGSYVIFYRFVLKEERCQFGRQRIEK